MSLSITLPNEIEEQVQTIAAHEGKAVESVVISAIARYVMQTAEDEGERGMTDSTSQAVARSQELYRRFKSRLSQRHPFLGGLSQAQAVELMERLSEKVAAGMDVDTWQEAEAFMRGENHYDFARHQYLHH
jgi:predicted transcriptional regulator